MRLPTAARNGRRPRSPIGTRLERLEDRTVPDASLSLSVSPTALWEFSGTGAATGTVTRSGFDLSQALTVSLTSSDTSEVTVPASVVIPAGQASTTFPVNAIDDSIVDGTQTAVITASAPVPGPGLTGPITLDTTWGSGGWVGNGALVGALTVQSDGKLVTAGSITGSGTNYYDFFVTRYNANGTADTTFSSPYGNVRADITGQKDIAHAVAVQSDGKIVVAGTGGNGPNFDWILARFNTDSTLDTTFGSGGKVVIDRSAGYDEIWDMALQGDGKIVVSGDINGVFSVGRLNPDGTLDATFGSGGIATTTFGSSLGSRAFGVALQSDGKIVAAGTIGGGNSTSVYGVARFNTDGTLDTTFGSGGTVTTDLPGVYDTGYDVVIQNGKIVVAGMTGRSNSALYDVALVRYNSDGSLDTTFGGGLTYGPNGVAMGSAGGIYAPVRLALQSDGRLVAVGSTGSSRSSSYGKIFRFSPDGVLENSTNSAFSTSVAENVAIDPNGGIYLAYTYGSTGASGYVDRYKSSGPTVSATASVTVADNDPFTAAADSYAVDENTVLTVGAPGLLANDTISVPNAPRAVLFSYVGTSYNGPSHGTVTVNADGSFTYTPNSGFSGTDTFYYQIVDGGARSNIAAVTVTVRRTVNNPPVSADDNYTVAEDTVLSTVLSPEAPAGNSLYMVSDAGDYIGGGKTYSYGATASYQMYNPYPSNPTYSNAISLSVSTSTDWWYLDFWAPNNARFVPGTTYTGAARFPFNGSGQPGMDISGDGRGSNTLTGQFTVLQAEYDATGKLTRFSVQFEQHSEGATAALRGTLRFNFQPSQLGVLNNDTDADHDPLAAVLVSGPSHGSLTLNSDGTFRYTPAANYSGTDSFTYKANDGYDDGNVATATITVTAVDDPPVSANDSYTTAEDTPLTVAAPGVLANDSDVEGDPLTASVVAGPAHGTLSFSATGGFTYTPAANYNGTDSFTYHVTDGTVYGNTATVSLTITPVYDPPIAANDTYVVVPGVQFGAIDGGVLRNDRSPDGLTLTAVLVSGPTNGTLTLNANGNFTYTRTAGTTGPDTFTYQAYDGTGSSNVATVRLDVAPTPAADSYTTAEDTAITVPAAAGVLANDTDPDGDTLTAVLYAYPAHGSLGWTGNGGFTYTPSANYNGTDSFSYRPYDGIAYGAVTTVTLTVTPVNDAPVAADDAYTTSGDATLVVNAPTSPAVTRLTMQSDPGDWLGGGQSYDLTPANGTFTAGGGASNVVIWYQNPANSSDYWSLTFAGVDYKPLTPGTYLDAQRAGFQAAGHPGLDISGQHRGANTVTGQFTVYQIVTDASGKIIRFWADFEEHADGITPALRGTIRFNASGTGAMPVLDNDTDVDGDTLSAVLVSGPSHGSLALNADGSFAYTPTEGYVGTDSFTYTANDGQLDSNVATATITVTPGNRAPVAAADAYSTDEDTPLTASAAAGVLANDSDPDGDPLTAVLVSGPSHGTLTLNADGSFTYTPTANYNGTDSFTYRASDGQLATDPVTVSLTIAAVNDPPVAVDDAFTTYKNTAITFTPAALLANDTDVDGDTLTTDMVDQADVGTVSYTMQNYQILEITYTPPTGFTGTAHFLYRPFDGQVYSSNVGTVTITVLPQNTPPASADDSYTTAEDTPLTVAAPGLLANDTDADNDLLTAVLVSGPSHGTLTLNANGSFSYTPAANYNGTDSFTYKANDGTADGNVATVNLTVTPVNDPPFGTFHQYSLYEDTTLTVAAPGLLDGSIDVDGDSLTAVILPTDVQAAHGTVAVNPDGSFTYTPDPNFNGEDAFYYRVYDGQAYSTNPARVKLNIYAVNDAPVAANYSYTTAEDTPFTVAAPGVLANDTDADNDPLTAVLVSGPSHGTLTLNASGSFQYTPAANYNGTDSFTYKANDGTADSNVATVPFTVTPVNDAPIAIAESYATNEDTLLSVGAPGVLANDYDVDGDPITAVLVTGPAHGTVTLNADGSFTYAPAADYNGPDSFRYKVNDGTVDGNTVTVPLTVNPVNDPPVGAPDSYTTAEDTALTVSAPGVLANDSDVDGNSLAAVLVSGPSHGTLTLNASGSFQYTPAANYNGTDSFTYKVSDGTAYSAPTTVSLTVTPVNDAPVAVADSYKTNEDTPLTVAAPGLLANDTDVDGDSLKAVLVSGPSHGSLTLNADGSFNYAPAANWNGTDTFTYKVNDGTVDGNTVTVSITVTAVDDAPVVRTNTPLSLSLWEGQPRTFDLSPTSDVDDTQLTFTWDFRDGSPVVTTYSAPNTISFSQMTHAFPDQGTYYPVFTVTDPSGLSSSLTFTVTVSNLAPNGTMTGPPTAVPGQDVAVTVAADDPGTADMAAAFQYQINWGDGTVSPVVSGPASGVTFHKTYTTTGTFSPWAWITDKDGATSQGAAFVNVSVVAAAVIDGTLYVGGTTGNDNITVRPADTSGALTVLRNGSTLGPFTPTGDVVVYGLAGGDQLTVNTNKFGRTTVSVTQPVYLFGGDGDDTLNASGASAGAVLSGGAGTDNLTGGAGDDILIGGDGADTLHGGSGSDILIGGLFDYDTDLAVLRSLGAEWWRADASFATRMGHLSDTAGGYNAVYLNGATIHNDGDVDQLYGQGGTDWFFNFLSGTKDTFKDYASGEQRTDL